GQQQDNGAGSGCDATARTDWNVTFDQGQNSTGNDTMHAEYDVQGDSWSLACLVLNLTDNGQHHEGEHDHEGHGDGTPQQGAEDEGENGGGTWTEQAQASLGTGGVINVGEDETANEQFGGSVDWTGAGAPSDPHDAFGGGATF